jgi:hypothetical protein
MKRIKNISLLLSIAFLLPSCNEWLQVDPQNEQLSYKYWSSQEDVEAVVNSGYYLLREMVTDYLIPFGELRSGQLFSIRSNKLQSFQVKAIDKQFSNWGPFYEIINIANVVLANAHLAESIDDTYEVEEMNAHHCEAYFLRALCYFYIVRNWREAPLITVPFEDDSHSYNVPKASEAELIEQIKTDIKTALATGAAKEYYETAWETKGRATKWAFFALMADVCLWSEDYETALTYCDYLLKANSPKAPAFLSLPTHNSWFSMFNPGNSNEAIFELQWNYEEYQTNNLPVLFDNSATDRLYEISFQLLKDFNAEYSHTLENFTEAVRSMYGGYYVADAYAFEIANAGYVWKYCGSKTLSDKRTHSYYDPNFIIYRVAEVILMKAEALALRSESEQDWSEAIDLINTIRQRSNLGDFEGQLGPREYSEDLTRETLLEWILYERRMELVGEGKSWYDVLRFGRRHDNAFKSKFLVESVLTYNNQAGQSWLSSVLSNDDALFLPIWEEELKTNTLLVQNPYYY